MRIHAAVSIRLLDSVESGPKSAGSGHQAPGTTCPASQVALNDAQQRWVCEGPRFPEQQGQTPEQSFTGITPRPIQERSGQTKCFRTREHVMPGGLLGAFVDGVF